MLYRASRHAYPDAAGVELVKRLKFGTVVSIFENELQFSHIPVVPEVVDDRLVRIRGHFSRANPHWRALEADPRATIVFNGPNAYISAQWYTPGHPAAPTWNYAVVHVSGPVRLAPSEAVTSAIIDELVRVNEAELPQQWPLESYSPERRAALLPHIIGFELEVTSFEPKFKLSQTYADADKRSAAAGLKSRGNDAAREIADLMLSTISGDGNSQGVDVTQRLREREEEARRAASKSEQR
ncbi:MULTISPECIES: FMN-binding negative transcriptional regulator [unclassified Chelatococcus]|uniref:FMN-binding negative transcriptional regulator n=1 Tax=unclassified Chelatococcus TaxID=2638111 RepID=UPI001BD14BD3|nr:MULTISPECIES: FMN-binding negative transcriptional regulator [unclassified Chelatococcus]MBS7700673.1 FMN-binding negative transcriptional regulator [Chelatococcus sp. YT9]MBX3559104.1 FMN-binding negative transcriptional regulator [Chelatococcus sp.]